jgi:hypothetical protein
MQVFEPLGPIADFASLLVALVCGGIASRLGGFWFYPGAILSFILFREGCLSVTKWVSEVRTRSGCCV